MIDLLYSSGAVNTTFWAALATFLVALMARLRPGPDPAAVDDPAGPVRALARSPLFIAFLGLGTLVNVGYGVYKGYVVPRDFMQDVISAQEFLRGRSLYPENMTELFVAEMESNPPRSSIWPEGSARRLQEAGARSDAASSPWTQAHPPLMTLFFTPFVRALGVSGAYFAVGLISLAALWLSLVLIAHGLDLKPGWACAAIVLAILGWDPIIDVFRAGQLGLVLSCLLVLGWYCLRRGWPVPAGVAVGAATCLKLYPGLLLFYLLIRHRRAFASALVTIALLTLLPVALCGSQCFSEFYVTARFVADHYVTYTANISLQGLLLRFLGGGRHHLALAQQVFAVLGVAIAAAVTWIVRHGDDLRTDRARVLDLEYSLFALLIPLLTPTSWGHYMVMLLLPIFVLGRRALGYAPGRSAALWYLGILAILAIPGATYNFTLARYSGVVSRYWCDLLVMAPPTCAMSALGLWLAQSVASEKRLVAEPSSLAPDIGEGALP